MIALYHQPKTPISFWCMRGLNSRYFIQPSETLPVKPTGTHGLQPSLLPNFVQKLINFFFTSIYIFHKSDIKKFPKVVYKQLL